MGLEMGGERESKRANDNPSARGGGNGTGVSAGVGIGAIGQGGRIMGGTETPLSRVVEESLSEERQRKEEDKRISSENNVEMANLEATKSHFPMESSEYSANADILSSSIDIIDEEDTAIANEKKLHEEWKRTEHLRLEMEEMEKELVRLQKEERAYGSQGKLMTWFTWISLCVCCLSTSVVCLYNAMNLVMHDQFTSSSPSPSSSPSSSSSSSTMETSMNQADTYPSSSHQNHGKQVDCYISIFAVFICYGVAQLLKWLYFMLRLYLSFKNTAFRLNRLQFRACCMAMCIIAALWIASALWWLWRWSNIHEEWSLCDHFQSVVTPFLIGVSFVVVNAICCVGPFVAFYLHLKPILIHEIASLKTQDLMRAQATTLLRVLSKYLLFLIVSVTSTTLALALLFPWTSFALILDATFKPFVYFFIMPSMSQCSTGVVFDAMLSLLTAYISAFNTPPLQPSYSLSPLPTHIVSCFPFQIPRFNLQNHIIIKKHCTF
ncbi:hypothetical protein RFI_12190 [Reticulomyxa filosa]|uniref:Uncharacterized protein n=1 Tax=Reticulomyxa filosa TaxID=46433 RepID=X6NG59_RETFI|nr:hypothetical protein RFI_12190 [Reticulomyxa filosa]|eukprot:ETO24951.1 hypothetical protein RFI_12190 [Reticulomyxa filosa]